LQLLDQIFVGEMHPPSVRLRLLRARCMVLLYEGKITDLALSAGMYLQLAQRHPQRFDLSSAHFMVACAHYFMAAQDDTALQHCWEILRHSHTTYRTTLVAAVSMLIELLLARGALAEAEQAAATFRSDAYRIQSPHALSDAALLDAQIAIHQNDLARALPWLQNFSGCSARPNELLSGVVWAAGLLALREPSWLAAGNGWVGAMLERCQATHAQVWVVRLQVLRARFFAAKGNRRAAQQSLHAALLIGCPNQLFRPFLVDDPALDPLLAVLSRQPDGQLAAAVLQRRRTGTPALPQPAAEPAPSPALPPLFEPLTDREAAVLQLLAGNLSRKEIAQTLQISVHTLDKHLRALYAKLQSHNRLEAVYRAHQRDLLLEP
jgi:ATP/maltotriose-dependent transcriptional regulator MalT